MDGIYRALSKTAYELAGKHPVRERGLQWHQRLAGHA